MDCWKHTVLLCVSAGHLHVFNTVHLCMKYVTHSMLVNVFFLTLVLSSSSTLVVHKTPLCCYESKMGSASVRKGFSVCFASLLSGFNIVLWTWKKLLDIKLLLQQDMLNWERTRFWDCYVVAFSVSLWCLWSKCNNTVGTIQRANTHYSVGYKCLSVPYFHCRLFLICIKHILKVR